jgi:uncharacterized membrane protein YhiD involved in acid resistance
MCLAMIFNLRIFEEFGKVLDLIRLPAYAMTSISFLGIGVIRSSSKNEGITTACTLLFLVVAGLGFGAGYYALNAGATLFAFLILKSKYLITDYINKQEKI